MGSSRFEIGDLVKVYKNDKIVISIVYDIMRLPTATNYYVLDSRETFSRNKLTVVNKENMKMYNGQGKVCKR